MLLSFIIPAYNASSTVVRTLDSIYSLAMNIADFEVIVIDDCSTDDTLRILNEYASLKSNIHVLHQAQNHRQGAARNWGVSKAKGDYLMFVDSDDQVENAVSFAVQKAKELKLDVLVCNYDVISPNYIEHRTLPIEYEWKEFNGIHFLEQVYDVIFNTCPINYLWKRDFIIKFNILFVEDRRMEDIDWIEKNLINAERICYYNGTIYTVIGQPCSTTRTTNIGTIADWLHFCHRRLVFAEQHKVDLPLFYNKVMADTPRFVYNNTRIRLLSNYSPKEINKIYQSIGIDAIETLRNYTWSMPTKMFIKYPLAEKIVLAFIYPITLIGRKIVKKLRTL